MPNVFQPHDEYGKQPPAESKDEIWIKVFDFDEDDVDGLMKRIVELVEEELDGHGKVLADTSLLKVEGALRP